jgi:predicted NAD-dependent protein-ADP-ribosyltransferase YbiA (DUF1768 family)
MSEQKGLPPKKGFGFKGKNRPVELLPEELREKAREQQDTRPEKVASMFGKSPEPVGYVYKRSASVKPKGVAAAVTQKAPPVVVRDTETRELIPETELAPVAEEAPPTKEEFAVEEIPKMDFEGDLKEMGDLIRGEEKKSPYEISDGPKAYVPQTRRAFSEFIKENYERFALNPGDETAPGDKYPYQKFVREYMRNDSPYRGILTYHGLGSGKTCTAIATAEALYATANKKIIVMTPFSLRKNFLKEVSSCGFRHFRLKNYWVSYPASDPTARIFATSVLGISESNLRGAQNVWIPDFRKTAEEANYTTLTAEQQTEIRKQILSILVWDEKKNPHGRIRFINYNGISAKKLQAMACQKPFCDFFDDSVIIIDEIHNLIRLMQGTIDPYLIKVAGLRRLIPIEDITPSHWSPKLCVEGTKTYMRGYLFYRLLLAAQNSKIVGLSGTPLINFPEELGILANVLHGYIPTFELTISETGGAAQKKAQEVCSRFLYSDYVEVKHDPRGLGTRVMITLLPQGIRKLADGSGVERIPEEEEVRDTEQVLEELKAAFTESGLQVTGEPIAKSLALLPPFGENFYKAFLKPDGSGLNETTKIVLVKRLTGLISYYKGSNEQLMPRVESDEVVRVPMSAYSQHMYMKEREAEVTSEAKKKKPSGGLSGVWGEVYEVGGESQTSNYKMASRQACNFTFPSEVIRPKPNKKDQAAEAKRGDKSGDILDTTPDSMEEKGAEEFPEMEAEDAEEEAEAAAAEEEEEGLREEIFQSGDTGAPAPDVPAVKSSKAAPALKAAKAVATAAPILFSLATENEYKMLDPLFQENIEISFPIARREMKQDVQTHTYRTLMHFYESVKYRDTAPDLEKKIRDAKTAEEAMELSKQGGADVPEKDRLYIMKYAIERFYERAHAVNVKELLSSTQNAPLVYASVDPFWGNGPDGKGENQIGKIWMGLREEHRGDENVPALQGGDEAARPEAPDDSIEGGGPEDEPTITAAPVKKFTLKRAGLGDLMAKKSAEFKVKCETGQQAGETYQEATQRAKQCLETIARDKMKLGPEGLSLYSPKFAAILTKIGEVAAERGSSLLYSQFLDMEGIGIFKIAMDVNGYAPIEIIKSSAGIKFSARTEESLRKGPGGQPRYITFSGGEEDDVRRICLDIFNANFNELPTDIKSLLVDEMKYTDNKTGQLCRVFCITSAGAEGISLKNVRGVHIMEPYWNDVRLKQVKGRAIRIGSHLELEESQRNVVIYTYLSVFSPDAQLATTGEARIVPNIRQHDRIERKDALAMGLPIGERATEYIITTDERLHVISERKKLILNALESVMKAAAVDCELNIKENKDGSFKCLPLRGKIGDFMYHPNLEDDIRESASKFQAAAPAAAAPAAPAALAAAPAAAAPAAKPAAAYIKQEYKGKPYIFKYVRPDPKAVATGFEIYAIDDAGFKKVLGRAGVRLPTEFGKEKPGKPVEFL